MAFNYSITLCMNQNYNARVDSLAYMATGYKLVITHFLGLLVECNYSALASYCILPAALDSGL